MSVLPNVKWWKVETENGWEQSKTHNKVRVISKSSIILILLWLLSLSSRTTWYVFFLWFIPNMIRAIRFLDKSLTLDQQYSLLYRWEWHSPNWCQTYNMDKQVHLWVISSTYIDMASRIDDHILLLLVPWQSLSKCYTQTSTQLNLSIILLSFLLFSLLHRS